MQSKHKHLISKIILIYEKNQILEQYFKYNIISNFCFLVFAIIIVILSNIYNCHESYMIIYSIVIWHVINIFPSTKKGAMLRRSRRDLLICFFCCLQTAVFLLLWWAPGLLHVQHAFCPQPLFSSVRFRIYSSWSNRGAGILGCDPLEHMQWC